MQQPDEQKPPKNFTCGLCRGPNFTKRCPKKGDYNPVPCPMGAECKYLPHSYYYFHPPEHRAQDQAIENEDGAHTKTKLMVGVSSSALIASGTGAEASEFTKPGTGLVDGPGYDYGPWAMGDGNSGAYDHIKKQSTATGVSQAQQATRATGLPYI